MKYVPARGYFPDFYSIRENFHANGAFFDIKLIKLFVVLFETQQRDQIFVLVDQRHMHLMVKDTFIAS